MSQIYRFKFAGEHFSVELESTDPVFIDQKLRELINLSIEQHTNGPRLLTAGTTAFQSSTTSATEEVETPFEPEPTEENDEEIVEQKVPEPSVRGPKRATTEKPKSKRGRKPGTKNKKGPKTTQAKAILKKEIEDIEEEMDPKQIVEVAKNSDDYRKIKKTILDKSNQLNRILLAFYYAQKTYGDRGFSSGTIEEVTKHFGKIIRRSNIAAQIKSNPSLFHSDQTPRRGVTVKYKLTSEGGTVIEHVIKGK